MEKSVLMQLSLGLALNVSFQRLAPQQKENLAPKRTQDLKVERVSASRAKTAEEQKKKKQHGSFTVP